MRCYLLCFLDLNSVPEVRRIYVTNLEGPYRCRQKSANASRHWDAANRTSTGFVSECIIVV